MGSLFDPQYLQRLASRYGIFPSKKYGQNYLVDEGVIENILHLSSISKNDTIVEVGPGYGVLTLPLVERAGRVIAFEIEKKLEDYWSDKRIDNLEIVWGNVIYKFAENIPNSPYKIVANLPYQITSSVIRTFLEAPSAPTLMVLMVQKEVGERICAKPGEMSLLSLSVQYYAEPQFEFVVPRTSFWPSPDVDSAVISIKNIKKALNDQEEKAVFELAKAGFANRRKLLIRNLEQFAHKDKIKKVFENNNLPLTARAQELSLDKWKGLAAALGPMVNA